MDNKEIQEGLKKLEEISGLSMTVEVDRDLPGLKAIYVIINPIRQNYDREKMEHIANTLEQEGCRKQIAYSHIDKAYLLSKIIPKNSWEKY